MNKVQNDGGTKDNSLFLKRKMESCYEVVFVFFVGWVFRSEKNQGGGVTESCGRHGRGWTSI